jgi:hypothetical protein
MNWADSNGIGYLPWAWWDASSLSGDAALYALYTGPDFTPKAPEGTAYKAHLASLAPVPVVDRLFHTLPLPATVTGIGSSLAAGQVDTGPRTSAVATGPGLAARPSRNRYLRISTR